MTDPITKIRGKAQPREVYGQWPDSTEQGLEAIKQYNEIQRAIINAKANKCQA